MSIAATIANLILLLAGLVGLGVQVWAFVDCLRAKAPDFERADKRTKGFWTAITGVSVVVGLIYVLAPALSFQLLLMLAACVGAGTYLADVRPALLQFRGGHQNGPYRPW